MSLIPRRSIFDMDHFLDDWWGQKPKADTPVVFSPRVDIHETKEKYSITADLPGVKKEDIHVTLHNGILSLEAKANTESTDEKDGKIVRKERFSGSYVRRFDLGDNVQEGDINAKFDNGVLKVDVPKHEHKKPEARKIDIQ